MSASWPEVQSRLPEHPTPGGRRTRSVFSELQSEAALSPDACESQQRWDRQDPHAQQKLERCHTTAWSAVSPLDIHGGATARVGCHDHQRLSARPLTH
eukprot:5668138-Amphidinium_carterae.1